MSQAKTAAQARWRARSPTHRVEVHLPAETVEILDALARAAGLSRTGLIERLIAAAAEPPRKEAPARPSSTVKRISD